MVSCFSSPHLGSLVGGLGRKVVVKSATPPFHTYMRKAEVPEPVIMKITVLSTRETPDWCNTIDADDAMERLKGFLKAENQKNSLKQVVQVGN